MLESIREKLKSDLTWQEKVQLVLDYHSRMCEGNPRHTLAMTANDLSVSEATISFDLRLARFLRSNPDKASYYPSKTKAIAALFSKTNYPRVEIKHPGTMIKGRLIRTLFMEEREYGLIKLDKPLQTSIIVEFIVHPAENYKVRYDYD